MKRHVLSLAFFFLPFFGMACSCSYALNFCETVSPQSNVASGEIIHLFIHLNFHYINVEYVETIQGKVETDTMTLEVGLLFSSCSPTPDAFVLGDTLIFSLDYEIAEPPSPFPTFRLATACSSNYRFVKNGLVTLPTGNGAELARYEDFVKNFGDCSAQVYDYDLEKLVYLFPNPAATEIRIAVGFPADIDFQIFTSSGQLIYESNTNAEGKRDVSVDVSHFPAGIYFVRFEWNGKRHTKRLVVY